MNALEHQKTYWLHRLSQPPPPPKLPCDKERPPISSFIRETISMRLAPGLVGGVKTLAARANVAVPVVLLAALKTLLFRYAGQTDLIVGVSLDRNAGETGTGMVALRTELKGYATALDLVLQIAQVLRDARANADLPISTVLEMLDHRSDTPEGSLFNVAFLFDESDDAGPSKSLHQWEQGVAAQLMTCALVLRANEVMGVLELSCEYDAELFESATIERFVGHLVNLLVEMVAKPETSIERLNLLDEAERRQILLDWNATHAPLSAASSIHQLIEEQAGKTPEAVAVICRDRQYTYAELNARANQLAARLNKLGAGPNELVGLCVERSLEMIVGLLGILKSGSAYLPLDPAYPQERLAYMVEDAKVKVVLTGERNVTTLPPNVDRFLLDSDWPLVSAESKKDIDRHVAQHDLAYVIYTSGSTGRPKGVMVEHGNVLNFFAGMDARISHGPGSTWLAVTSPSFDISVLELFWTLARGLTVVIFAGDEAPGPAAVNNPSPQMQPMEFSLFYFSSDQNDGPGGAYRLLTEGARFADEHGFAAVWTPERHFHEFGGLYPNPSVTSAALAMITKRAQIRSGSVVAPLHSPIRIAEEWSVVDNLSNGRVAISFASGWMPEDFTVNPGNYERRKEVMVEDIDIVRRLWRGESVSMPGPLGKEVAVKIFPRPVQKELPMWLTAAGNPETFQMAGRLGMNLLTHLLGQSIDDVSQKVALYRRAWKEAGHVGRGHVTLMLHTFLGEKLELVKETVREPLTKYLRDSADLIKSYAWAFSPFKQRPKSTEDADFRSLSKPDMDALLAHAFDRYFETSGLFGTPESCRSIIANLEANDVDEVACLIDFGVDSEVVLDHLKYLDVLRETASRGPDGETADYSIPALIQRHQVTHLQCTPTMAGMLLADERAKVAFQRLQCLMIGGEPFPPALARQLQGAIKGEIVNMYGPTETTVWSTTYRVLPGASRIPVGHPIANTEIYILDHNLLPLPVGVVGELMIGGAGVARGYLGRPELTAQRFIRNPFQANGARLYRTGDLARYLPNGGIELLGRTDQQIKIRGHRVELGEIESALSEHPAVRESVVVARENANGDKRLVAYIVPKEAQRPTQNQLRQFASGRLPEHMVPAQVVFVSEFPQTPNKKIDRKALPAPNEAASEVQEDFERPKTEVEETLAVLWSELLDVQRVGRRDNFFESGGHSLLAMQLVGRVRARFGVDLPLKNLFENPTVAGLAETIDALSWSANARMPVEAVGEREEVEV